MSDWVQVTASMSSHLQDTESDCTISILIKSLERPWREKNINTSEIYFIQLLKGTQTHCWGLSPLLCTPDNSCSRNCSTIENKGFLPKYPAIIAKGFLQKGTWTYLLMAVFSQHLGKEKHLYLTPELTMNLQLLLFLHKHFTCFSSSFCHIFIVNVSVLYFLTFAVLVSVIVSVLVLVRQWLTEHGFESNQTADEAVEVDVHVLVCVAHGDDVVQLVVETEAWAGHKTHDCTVKRTLEGEFKLLVHLF